MSSGATRDGKISGEMVGMGCMKEKKKKKNNGKEKKIGTARKSVRRTSLWEPEG